jgi:hypothetical protein
MENSNAPFGLPHERLVSPFFRRYPSGGSWRRRDEVTQHDKSKREERLVKALRDNLRRRKPALRKSAKAAGDSDAVPEPAVKIEAKPTS